MDKIPITVENEQQLREEIEKLKSLESPRIVNAIATARESETSVTKSESKESGTAASVTTTGTRRPSITASIAGQPTSTTNIGMHLNVGGFVFIILFVTVGTVMAI